MRTPRTLRPLGPGARLLAASLAVAIAGLAGCGEGAPATPPAPKNPGTPAPASAPFVPVDQRILIAKSMLRASRFDQAETALRVVLRDHPDDAQARFLLGLAIHKQKRYSEAMQFLERALASQRPFPELDDLFYVQAWCAYNLGDLPRARAAFEEHMRRVPAEPDTVFGLGVIALDEDRLDEAEQRLSQAIAMQAAQPGAARELAKAHARLADVHLRRDAVEAAEESLRRAIALYPDHYEAWAKLARVLERRGLAEEAAAARAEEQAAMVRVGRLGSGSNQDGALPAPGPGGTR